MVTGNMDSPVTQVHLGHDNIRDFCIGIVHAVQAAREQQELVCSMRDDELGAKQRHCLEQSRHSPPVLQNSKWAEQNGSNRVC